MIGESRERKRVHQAQAVLLIAAAVYLVIRVSLNIGSVMRKDRDQLSDSETFTLHGMSKSSTTVHGVSPFLFLNCAEDNRMRIFSLQPGKHRPRTGSTAESHSPWPQ